MPSKNILIIAMILSIMTTAAVSNNTIYSTSIDASSNVTNINPNSTSPGINNVSNLNVERDLDIASLPLSNGTEVIKNGTLLIDGLNVPIKYEQINGLKILEGDILLSAQVIDNKAALDKFIITGKWTNGEIPYIIDSRFPNPKLIEEAIADVKSDLPRLLFREANITPNGQIADSHYLNFIYEANDASVCMTFAGMLPNTHPLFKGTIDLPNGIYGDKQYHGQPVIIGDGCSKGNVIHEIGHTLGLWHEQTRCDRNQHIEIDELNIKPNKVGQYIAKCSPAEPTKSPTDNGTPYDYCSIMHYPRGGMNAIDPTKPIMTPIEPVVGCKDIGQRNGFSPIDIQAINSVYRFLGFH
ncbi:MAG: M12 family metallopeptidase [Candidatus Nitrosocosmicus sp.]